MNKNIVKITYAEPWLPFHHRLFINIVETCSARIALKKRYETYTDKVKDKKGNALWDQAIESLGIIKPNFLLPEKNKKRGLVIAANHPFGVTDGVFLAWIASRIDPKFKVIAHGILQKEPSLAHSILPIDFSNSKNAMRNNVLVRRKAIEILKKNGVIAIFPAGAVAWSRRKGQPVQEEIWKPMLGKIINSSKCDFLLTKFEGSNSNLFQVASRIHQTVKQSLYLYEIKKSLDKPINFKVCKYYKNEELPYLDDKSLALFLQTEVEKY
jgi:putative hemolysin